jgi:hypothetical protein
MLKLCSLLLHRRYSGEWCREHFVHVKVRTPLPFLPCTTQAVHRIRLCAVTFRPCAFLQALGVTFACSSSINSVRVCPAACSGDAKSARNSQPAARHHEVAEHHARLVRHKLVCFQLELLFPIRLRPDRLVLLLLLFLLSCCCTAGTWCARRFALLTSPTPRASKGDFSAISFVVSSSPDSWAVLRVPFRSIGQYVNLRTGMPCHLHPTSVGLFPFTSQLHLVKWML